MSSPELPAITCIAEFCNADKSLALALVAKSPSTVVLSALLSKAFWAFASASCANSLACLMPSSVAVLSGIAVISALVLSASVNCSRLTYLDKSGAGTTNSSFPASSGRISSPPLMLALFTTWLISSL